MKILKKALSFLIVALVSVLGVIVFANWKISHDADPFLYDSVDSIPAQKVALVLGASPYLGGGYKNPYFTHRMTAAKELYDAGKAKAFLLSGDNMHHSYNEPKAMREALLKLGIPDSVLYLDYAGFRTLDSVVRACKVFGQDSFIVVSQRFHNERAVFLAQHFGITVYGYNADDVAFNRTSSRTVFREYLAKVKVFVDIITNKQPKFLGDPIEIR